MNPNLVALVSTTCFGMEARVILPIYRFLASVSKGEIECSFVSASGLLQLLLGLKRVFCLFLCNATMLSVIIVLAGGM